MSLQRYCTTLLLKNHGEISTIYDRIIRSAEEVVHGAVQAIRQLGKVIRFRHGCAHHGHHVIAKAGVRKKLLDGYLFQFCQCLYPSSNICGIVQH